jgi:hypothetical protein
MYYSIQYTLSFVCISVCDVLHNVL